MRAFINGVEGGAIDLQKGADVVYNIRVTNDDGSLIDVTADTDAQLILYDTADRKNTAILSIVGAVVAAAQGTLTATLTDAQTAALTSGATYYAFVRRDAGSTTYSFGNKHTAITMK